MLAVSVKAAKYGLSNSRAYHFRHFNERHRHVQRERAAALVAKSETPDVSAGMGYRADNVLHRHTQPGRADVHLESAVFRAVVLDGRADGSALARTGYRLSAHPARQHCPQYQHGAGAGHVHDAALDAVPDEV